MLQRGTLNFSPPRTRGNGNGSKDNGSQELHGSGQAACCVVPPSQGQGPSQLSSLSWALPGVAGFWASHSWACRHLCPVCHMHSPTVGTVAAWVTSTLWSWSSREVVAGALGLVASAHPAQTLPISPPAQVDWPRLLPCGSQSHESRLIPESRDSGLLH